ncbi:MAG: hypothetical protein PHS28_05435 [Atopobiaceae bacterium]|jgi:hypothetical protein|nr:hypothetical protein [Atopobiaceae bacterium]
MDVPDSVTILGIRYDVTRPNCTRDDGSIDPHRQVIEVASGMSDERAGQTFLHEVIHGVLDQLGYEELYQDEHLVQGLAVGLYQALFQATSSC